MNDSTVIQHQQTKNSIRTITIIDTMFFSGNNIVKENTSGEFSWQLSYTLFPYLNPLSYVNNFSLMASDYKNGDNASIFYFFSPQNITRNLTWERKRGSSSLIYNTSLDSIGRVLTVGSENRVTTFEYY